MRVPYLYSHFADSKGNNNSAWCGPLKSCYLSPASDGWTMSFREVRKLAQGHTAGTEGAGSDFRTGSKASFWTGVWKLMPWKQGGVVRVLEGKLWTQHWWQVAGQSRSAAERLRLRA